jgi:hypothetical protein
VGMGLQNPWHRPRTERRPRLRYLTEPYIHYGVSSSHKNHIEQHKSGLPSSFVATNHIKRADETFSAVLDETQRGCHDAV